MKKIWKFLSEKWIVISNSIAIFMLALSPQIALAAPTGNGLKTWFIDLCKNGATIFLLYRVLESFARQSVAKMAFALLFGGIVLWIVNSPDSAASIMRQVGELIGQ